MIQKTYVGEAGKNLFFTEELSVILSRMINVMPKIEPIALRISWLGREDTEPQTVFNVEFQDDDPYGQSGNFVRRERAKLKIAEYVAYESMPLFDELGFNCLALPTENGEFLIACSGSDSRLELEVQEEVAACIAVMHEILDPSIAEHYRHELGLSPRRLNNIRKWLLTSKESAAHEWRG